MSDLPEKTTFLSRVGHNFLTGLFLVMPLGLTFYVVTILVGLIGAPVQGILQAVLPLVFNNPDKVIHFESGPLHTALVITSALIMAMILVTLGWLSKRIFGKIIHRWFAEKVERMPGLGAIYNTIRQMVDALSGRNKDTFRRVVLVQFPPTAGFILQVPEKEIRETSLTVPDAITLLMSFGSVLPTPKVKK
ncbi:DUF502 domain-containing protein [bacterium]|nr:DUF502 domain-containing protein [bacterium]